MTDETQSAARSRRDDSPVDTIRMGEARYTRADVASRNGSSNSPVWIIIRDQVYDVTRYVNEHPGGSDLVLEHAGKDATRDFDDAGHSSDAKTILVKLRIGEIVEEEKHYDANGKKKKRVVAAKLEDGGKRSCLNMITCGLVG